MTREEALNKDIVRCFEAHFAKSKEAREAAVNTIKALEQEPCDDAISRQAAIDAMYALCDTGETLKENPWRDNPHIDAITDALDNLPPVTPQVGTARRIVGKSRGGMTLWYQCEICNEPIDERDAFCSGCGRRLVNG